MQGADKRTETFAEVVPMLPSFSVTFVVEIDGPVIVVAAKALLLGVKPSGSTRWISALLVTSPGVIARVATTIRALSPADRVSSAQTTKLPALLHAPLKVATEIKFTSFGS